MKAKTLMVQGTASHVGKSSITMALCRYYARRGYRVAPFKAQNMALNAFVTPGGGEIGWAQAVQARAAGCVPEVHMNPILLKPIADDTSQVVLLGKAQGNMQAKAYFAYRQKALEAIEKSLYHLGENFDLIVIEGGGSPAEVNLRGYDLVNMETARLARSPVLLTGDIDRGGVFAYLVGTMELLTREEKKRIAGFIINKFRGDVHRLSPGIKELEERTGKPLLGVLPYLTGVCLPQEDSLSLGDEYDDGERGTRDARREGTGEESQIHIGVVQFSHIANFSDFDPLRRHSRVHLRYISPGDALGEPDILILPGSKHTIQDLRDIKKSGLGTEIKEFARRGKTVIGICGGYQMLGRKVSDPRGVEGTPGEEEGLGLLPVSTVMEGKKVTRQVTGTLLSTGEALVGYEIHAGRSTLHEGGTPMLDIRGTDGELRACGCANEAGNVWGCYLHGLFGNDAFRIRLLNEAAAEKGLSPLEESSEELETEKVFDVLASWVEKNLDMAYVNRLILGSGKMGPL